MAILGVQKKIVFVKVSQLEKNKSRPGLEAKNEVKTVRIFQMTANFPDDFEFRFFGNVVRGKSALFRLVMRNGFAHFVQKVFVRRKLLPGKFWVFAPLVTYIKFAFLMTYSS